MKAYKQRTERIECANILDQTSYSSIDQLRVISDPLRYQSSTIKSMILKEQENQIYTIVKGRDTFYLHHTISLTSCCEVKYVFIKRLTVYVVQYKRRHSLPVDLLSRDHKIQVSK